MKDIWKSGLGDDVSVELRERPWTTGLYYLHGDHLGTATFVTNSQGDATQFFLNLPFGETMFEQMDGSYDNPFKFNAKELDEDTGLYYYGARYYNPRLSIWYGVDPLAETMPSWSPYVYTFNNPVRYTDPTGMKPEGDYYDSKGKYLGNDGIDDNKVYQLTDRYNANFENKDVNWGGTLSEKHYTELQGKSNSGTVENMFVTGDPVSDKRIQSLHPAIRMQATNFINEANDKSEGTLIRVAQGFRTYEEQNALYAQGRTTKGSIVTKARGGQSNHNFGLAFDIVGVTNGNMDYNLDWKSLSEIGKSNGLDWGGDWKFKDMPHFENMFGKSLQELRSLPKSKKGLPILKR
ncbi:MULTISPECIES: RHS repeat-associated core domain-containing protein [Chryseobacterium]|uniref:RHS repeat-associated core domain-containing protein n=1 Tax=Chryseobacterium TaxID=59732 RepID=UPI001625CCFF|nr:MULTISPECIES: RHS repeat-associated core domain-containing protein [Chryseobacterium]